jgi:uncharacterized membrane protein YeaQ/YmgE (transglycosylase-associated protein family)
MELLPLVLIGFVAGMVSGAVVGGPATGYLASVLVGVAGALFGGWLNGALGFGSPGDLVSGLVVAVIGSIAVRLTLRSLQHR